MILKFGLAVVIIILPPILAEYLFGGFSGDGPDERFPKAFLPIWIFIVAPLILHGLHLDGEIVLRVRQMLVQHDVT